MQRSRINLQKNAKGLSGLIKFDTQGFRSDYVLEIIELIESGINKIGTWNSTEGLNITRHPMDYEVVQPIEGSLRDKSFKVLLALVRIVSLKHTYVNSIDVKLFFRRHRMQC